jgi:hypothetical protein
LGRFTCSITLQFSAKSSVSPDRQPPSDVDNLKPCRSVRLRQFCKRFSRKQVVSTPTELDAYVLEPYVHGCCCSELATSLDTELPTYSPWELPVNPDVKLSEPSKEEFFTTQERPSPLVMASISHRHEEQPVELEGPLPYALLSRQSSSASFERFHKQSDYAQAFVIHHAPTPLSTPPYPQGTYMEANSSMSPESINEVQSHTLSPVSPVTPSLNNAYGSILKKHSDISPVSFSASPGQRFSPSLESYTDHYETRDSFSIPEPSLSGTAGRVHESAEDSSSWFRGVVDTEDFSNNYLALSASMEIPPMYQALGNESISPSVGEDSKTSWNGLIEQNCTTRVTTRKTSPWHRRLVQIQMATGAALSICQEETAYGSALLSQDISTTTIKRSKAVRRQHRQGNLPCTQTSTEPKEPADYPTEMCDVCQKEFTGRYVCLRMTFISE